MKRPLPLLFSLFLGVATVASAVQEIVPARHASQVVAVGKDVITLVSGSTYSFTVDTPEDQGLVSTKPQVADLLRQLQFKDGAGFTGRVMGADGIERASGQIQEGDKLVVGTGSDARSYQLKFKSLALPGRLQLDRDAITLNVPRDLTLSFTAGQRSPDATVRFHLPAGIEVTLDNTTVNVIGRGVVTLRGLPTQSIGRVGSAYSYTKVGEAEITRADDGGTLLTLKHLDLRPANGADIVLVIRGAKLTKAGAHTFQASYTTPQPEVLTSAGTGEETATLTAVATIADFTRVVDRSLHYQETPATYTSANFKWTPGGSGRATLMHSTDEGRTWVEAAGAKVDAVAGTAGVTGLAPNQLHLFRLQMTGGTHTGPSNAARFYSGKLDLKSRGVVGDGQTDDTQKINEAITWLADIGGGTLLFSAGTYQVRTVHLRSNITLYVDNGATILALKGGDAPEATWFSDKKYRSGLSPTDPGPYANPENWLTKQDVGHHYFRNTMFFGERLDNVKIVGTGRISGNGNLVTGDRVMNNAPDNRSDKMFTFKLCTNLEIGGLRREEDLWYDPAKDDPYYLARNDSRSFDHSTMLHIDRGGHFVLLATGTDHINVHDTYFAKHHSGNARDIYDFMQCNDVTVTNIYSKVSSDDIVKPGSDCSLGFTRPAKGYRVRNIIGDTNCNLFQIGSETADDITDVHVDNIYVLGANKAGFSISTNDGATVKDIHLNCGHTGSLHSRSRMLRTHTPFFISISNRGRVLGATVARFKFDENGKAHDELLNTNINIGVVENIILNGIDVTEQYAGSSHGAPNERWKVYDGKQRKAAPIIAGYKLPDSAVVQGGLTFRLPNGEHTGYIRNVVFRDVHFLAKGGNPATDAARQPPELGVGQYNASNLGVLPAYGLYARHVKGLTLEQCTFNYEQRDSTPALLFDDVIGARLTAVKLVRAKDQPEAIKLVGSRELVLRDVSAFADAWGNAPQPVTLP